VIAYTAAGAATSALVGSILGVLGAVVLPSQGWLAGYLVLGAVAALAIARELVGPSIPVPQLRRQTPGIWAKTHGSTASAILWGLDLGLIFTTWFTFSGAWFVVALAVASGQAAFGAIVVLAYWLGRALSVWVAPLMMPTATATPALLAALGAEHRLFKIVHVAALGWSVVLLAMLGIPKPT
jgi:hypothetical protein